MGQRVSSQQVSAPGGTELGSTVTNPSPAARHNIAQRMRRRISSSFRIPTARFLAKRSRLTRVNSFQPGEGHSGSAYHSSIYQNDLPPDQPFTESFPAPTVDDTTEPPLPSELASGASNGEQTSNVDRSGSDNGQDRTARSPIGTGTLLVLQGVLQANETPGTLNANSELLGNIPAPPSSGHHMYPHSRFDPSSRYRRNSPLFSPTRTSNFASSFSTAERQTASALSSIDVLASLLSVAAASTAASLVSRSGSSSGPEGQATAFMNPNVRPQNVDSTNSSIHRNRNAWDSFRDRLFTARTPDLVMPDLPSSSFPSRPHGVLSPPMEPNNRGGVARGLSSMESHQGLLNALLHAMGGVAGAGSRTIAGGSGFYQRFRESVDAPVGSFDRFLSDMQMEVRLALLRSFIERRRAALSTPNTTESLAHSSTRDGLHRDGRETNSPSQSMSAAESLFATMAHNNENNGSDGQGGITWWRSFRFLTGQENTINSDNIESSTSRVTLQDSSNQISMNAGPEQSSASATESPLIPVIVVGLQSVSRNNTPRQTSGSQDSVSSGTPENVSHENPIHRLAELLQHRIPTSEQQPVTTADGNAYLIFVLGGFYPPDHTMVTAGDNLNSFDALRHLSELLGQIKSPVATKDQIAQAGLEVLKPVVLRDYLKDGKVSESTVDRCLICLEDYQAEEDVRLLKCRHAFHIGCVDMWLEQGRNNCPACRSEGVPTSTSS